MKKLALTLLCMVAAVSAVEAKAKKHHHHHAAAPAAAVMPGVEVLDIYPEANGLIPPMGENAQSIEFYLGDEARGVQGCNTCAEAPKCDCCVPVCCRENLGIFTGGLANLCGPCGKVSCKSSYWAGTGNLFCKSGCGESPCA